MVAISVNQKPIRLTQERISHIVTGHPELEGCERMILETLENPDLVLEGDDGAFMAVRRYAVSPVSKDKYLVVVYREGEHDGFVITAYFTRRYAKWRRVLWQR